MAISYSSVSERIFSLLTGLGFKVKSYDSEGKLVVDPSHAERIFVDEPNILVRIDRQNEEIKLAASEDVDDQLRTQIKDIANDYLLNFDYRQFGRKLKAKSETIDVAQKMVKDMDDVMEGFGTMSGSSKTSYQPLDNIRIVVKHKKAVNEETRGARSRNIHSILIQRGDERFKMAENNLKAARAMARHLQMGGEVHDSVGTAISEMADEQSKLKEFVGYVRKNKLVNEDNQQYVELATENIEYIKRTLDKLCGAKTYANASESVNDRQSVSILTDDIDIESKFVQTHFDDKVANAMDSIKKSLGRQQSYREGIQRAIRNETFDNLRDMLSESDVLDFATPHAKLSYQVSQLGSAAQNDVLRNHLHGISKKLEAGGSLDQFEYGTIKSCLLSASEARVQDSVVESVEDKYEQFLEKFDIL